MEGSELRHLLPLIAVMVVVAAAAGAIYYYENFVKESEAQRLLKYVPEKASVIMIVDVVGVIEDEDLQAVYENATRGRELSKDIETLVEAMGVDEFKLEDAESKIVMFIYYDEEARANVTATLIYPKNLDA
ncbi:MAG: hypothetical protein ABIH99_03460, partial [Candidatus Micrarchaeota archaeon]